MRLRRAYNRTDVLLIHDYLRSSCVPRSLPIAYPVRADSANLAGVAGPSSVRGTESRINEDRTGNLASEWHWNHSFSFQGEVKHRAAKQQHQW
jgi:hypothetical protein